MLRAGFQDGRTGRSPNASDSALRMLCGDALFSHGSGHVFDGTPSQMVKALDRLRRLPNPRRCTAPTNTRCATSPSPPSVAIRTTRSFRPGASARPSGIAKRADGADHAQARTRGQSPSADRRFPLRDRVRRQFGTQACDRVSAFSALRSARNTFRFIEPAPWPRDAPS